MDTTTKIDTNSLLNLGVDPSLHPLLAITSILPGMTPTSQNQLLATVNPLLVSYATPISTVSSSLLVSNPLLQSSVVQSNLTSQIAAAISPTTVTKDPLFNNPISASVATPIRPNPPTLKLAASSDTGASSSDRITKITTPTIAGTGDVGSKIKLNDGNTVVGQATVGTDGKWQIATSQLSNGSHQLIAIATDSAGRVSLASSALAITIDNLAPKIQLDDSFGSTVNSQSKLAGKIDGTGSAARLTYQWDNRTPIAVTVGNEGNFEQSFDLSGLSSGTHTLTLISTDLAGNNSTKTASVKVLLPVQPPTITALLTHDTAPGGAVNTDKITADPQIQGKVTSIVTKFLAGFDSTVTSRYVNILPQLQADGSFSLNRATLDKIFGRSLTDGTHTLHLVATASQPGDEEDDCEEGGGKTTKTDFIFTLDTLAPQLTVTSPLKNNAKLTGTANGTGSDLASISYAWDNSTTTMAIAPNATGGFDQLLDFTGVANGVHKLTITATDLAGNVTATAYNTTVTVDWEAPVITAKLTTDTGSNSDKITNDGRISGTVTDTSSLTSFKAGFDSKPIASYADVLPYLSNGGFSFTKAQLETIYGGTIPDGSHTLNLVATDQYGNQSSVYPYTFTLDTITPIPTLNLAATSDSGVAGDYRTKSPLVTLTGKVEANARVLLSGNPTPVTADSAGNYTFTNVALAVGNNSFTVTATDIAGNQKAYTQLVYRTSPPTGVTLSTPQILENTVNNTQVGVLSSIDPDGADNYVYTLVDNAGGRFKLVGDKIQVANGSLLDFETNTQHQIQVQTTDGEGDSYLQTITIAVLNVNESPTNLSLSSTTIVDNSPSNTIIGQITSIDPDAGDTFSYSLVVGTGDGDNSKFAISGDKLVIKNSPDYETQSSYTVRLRTTDAGGLTFDKQVNINVANVNEAPISLTFSNNTVAENSGLNSVVGTFTSTDPDLGDTKTYALTSGLGDIDNSQFTIVGDKLQLKPNPDFETKSTYQLRAKVTDAGGLSYQQAFRVNISNVNEIPIDFSLSNNTVTENTPVGGVIGNLSTIDPDSGDTHTYSLVNGNGSGDNSAFSISNNQLKFVVSPDFETKSNYSLRVRTTDAGGLSMEKQLTVNITNVNEAPTQLVLDTTSVAENSPIGTLIGKFATTDPDIGDTHTYSLVTGNGSGDNPKFAIINNELRLSFSPDFETQSVYHLRVQTKDVSGLTWQQELTVNIIDLPENNPNTLVEGTSFNKRLAIPVTVPTTGGKLNFKLNPLQFDGTDLKGIKDALEVALVDTQGKSVVTTFQTGRDAFFNWTEGETVVTGKGVSFDSTTGIVTLDLTGVKPGQTNLVFHLINDDRDTTTNVTITDVILSPLTPLPLPIAPLLSATPTTPNPVAPNFFNSATDVSASIGAAYHRTSFNEGNKELDVNVALKNQGSYGLNGTLVAIVNHISDPSVQIKNADGFTADGLAYYTFTATNGKLDPTQATFERTLVFRNPNGVQFSYDLTVLSQLNVAPVIKSQPEIEVIGGKKYQYQVKAEDLNGDSLTYKLLSAPSGMAIDPTTGLVSWNTSVGQIGNDRITVEVSDGRGGVAQQDYNLAVITPPPNRPPVFTSTPVVDAAIGSVYNYQGIAKDPDGDSLIYSLISAPTGMSVDANTGVLTWKPIGSQLGTFDVSLGVTDGQGGNAQQQFKIRTGAAAGNHAPITTSDAVIAASVTQSYTYQVTAVDPDLDPLTYQLGTAPTGMVIDSNTGKITWNNPVLGTTQVDVTVRDNLGGIDTQTYNLDVSNLVPGTLTGQVFVDDGRGRDTLLYFNDFENPTRTLTEWSNANLDVTPLGNRHFLGRYGGRYYANSALNQNRLTLPTIGEHDKTTVSFKLYINDSWNGSTGSFSPDLWDLKVVGGQTLLHASFGSGYPSPYGDRLPQSYPDPFIDSNPTANLYPAGTGASQTNVLGYYLTDPYGDAVYALSFTFDHTASNLALDFIGNSDESINNESWGLDDVEVRAIHSVKGIANATVYLDSNANNLRDANELTTQTDAGGNYSFTVAPGNYRVAEELPPGVTLSTPTSQIYQVAVANNQTLANLDFGNKSNVLGNVAPTFLNSPLTQITVGQKYSYRAVAADLNGDPLTYNLVVNPDGAVIDAKTGLVSWLPTLGQLGTKNFVVRAADGGGGVTLQSFTVNVSAANTAPQFTNDLRFSSYGDLSVSVGVPLAYRFQATDAEGDPIAFALNTPTNGATIDSTTGVLNWIPNNTQLGNNHFVITASDGRGGVTTQPFDINVAATSANLSPVISSTPRKQTPIGQTYAYQIAATDPNSDPLTYSLVNPPAGMSVNDKGLLSWTPTAAQLGQSTVKIQVSDGRGGITTQDFSLEVVNSANLVNHAPEITSTPTFTTNLDKTYSYQLTGKDSDNDTLIWSLDKAPTGMVIDSSTGIVKWNPTSTQLGTHTIAVRLTDAYRLYVGQEYTLKVNGVNTPPQIQSTPNTVGGLNSPYKYQVKAVDLEGDVLKYTLGRNPVGMVVNSDTGLITWIPNATQTGTQIIDILVTDAQGAVSTQTYNLVVGTTPINQPPTITSTPKFTADINSKYQYQVIGTDSENQQLTYSLTNPPSGMVIDANTGLITWNNPTLGTTQITIAVTDASGATATQGYTLTGKQNHTPVINSTPVTQVIIGNSYRYDVVATDSDNDMLTYSLDNASKALGITIDKLGRITWQPASPNIGVKPVTVTVTDTSGATVTQAYNLEVLTDTSAPVINLLSGTNIANIGDTISFQVQATDNVGIKSEQLLINNQAVALDANGVGTYTVTVAGVVTAQAIVTDVNGNATTKTSTINVIDSTDIEAPTVKLDLSGIADGIITGRTDIQGTVTDTNLDYYTLEVARLGSDNFTEVFRGTNSVANGILGRVIN